eukprot:4655598-Prorocentrum_lima.AAC.1
MSLQAAGQGEVWTEDAYEDDNADWYSQDGYGLNYCDTATKSTLKINRTPALESPRKIRTQPR